MTNVKPATDEEIAAMPDRFAAPAEWGGGVTVDEAFSLLARIDADREEIARLTDEAVSVGLAEDRAMKAQARLTLAQEEIAFLKSRYERDMCADGHERIRYTPDEDFGPCPLCLCWEEVATLKAQVAEWEAKARNWLASPEAAAQLEGYRSLGQRTADAENARDIALAEIAALKAEVERPRCNDLLCRCCARRAR